MPQWNPKGYRYFNNLAELKQLLSFHQPLLIALQETYLTQPPSSFSFPNYAVFLHDQTEAKKASGGNIIIIRANQEQQGNSLKYTLHDY